MLRILSSYLMVCLIFPSLCFAQNHGATHFGSVVLDAPLAVTSGGTGNATGDVSGLNLAGTPIPTLLGAGGVTASMLASSAAATNLTLFTPQMINPAAGSGGDDTTYIQGAVDAVVASGGGTVFFPRPSSGAYNICSAHISVRKSDGKGVDVHFVGIGEGANPIRLKPGCGSPPNELFYISNGWTDQTKSRGKVSFESLRIDGRGLVKHEIYADYVVALSITKSVIRNSAAGGDNVNIVYGYESYISDSVKLENMNDADNAPYSDPWTFPAFNFVTNGTDGIFNPIAIGAYIANFYAGKGGENKFGGHGWGYAPGNGDSQPVSLPLYNYLTAGVQHLNRFTGDQPILALSRQQVVPTTGQVNIIAQVSNGGSGGTAGIVNFTGTTGTGTKFQGIGTVDADGVLHGPVVITQHGQYTVNPTLSGESITGTGVPSGATVNISMASVSYDQSASVAIDGIVDGYGSAATMGFSLAADVWYPVIVGVNLSQLNNRSLCIVSDSGYFNSPIFANNPGCGIGQTIRTYGNAAQETALTLNNPYSGSYATTILSFSANGRIRSQFLAQQAAASLGGSLIVQCAKSSGSLFECARFTTSGGFNVGSSGADPGLDNINAQGKYYVGGTVGHDGTASAGSSSITVTGGIITGIVNNPQEHITSDGAAAQETQLILENPYSGNYATSTLSFRANGRIRSQILSQQAGAGTGGSLVVQCDEAGVLIECARFATSGGFNVGSSGTDPGLNNINAQGKYYVGGTVGYDGTVSAGRSSITISGGIITGITNNPQEHITSDGLATQETPLILDNPNTNNYATSILSFRANGAVRAQLLAQQYIGTNSGSLAVQCDEAGVLTECARFTALGGLNVGSAGTDPGLGNFRADGFINGIGGFKSNGVAGFSGTKTAGSCVMTISGGIITNVTGC